MLDHVSLQAVDVDRSADFYLRVFAALGLREIMRNPRGDSFVVGLGGAPAGCSTRATWSGSTNLSTPSSSAASLPPRSGLASWNSSLGSG
jgi:catechol 2,3-dioxygenase-like lactoylglutathione lyase family enzyme